MVFVTLERALYPRLMVPRDARRGSARVLPTLACWAALLIAAVVLFRFLHFVLQERFLAVLVGIVALSLVLNVAFIILWRRRPDLVARLRSAMERHQQRALQPYGRVTRSFFAVVGVLSTAVALVAGWAMYSAPDFALFFALWVVPAAYLAVTGLYLAVTGNRNSFADAPAFLLLWPW
jgi:hypothetical protein